MEQYDKWGRLKYNPEFHDRHGEKWTKDELMELCALWEVEKTRDIALGLGRTDGVCRTKVCSLRKIGLYNYYKKEFKKSFM